MTDPALTWSGIAKALSIFAGISIIIFGLIVGCQPITEENEARHKCLELARETTELTTCLAAISNQE